MTLTLTLSPEVSELISEQIASGRFESAEEVVAEGVRLFKQRTDFERFRRDELRREVDKGIEEARAGKVTSFDADAMKQRLREAVNNVEEGR